MARTVQEIMNRELLSIGPQHSAREARLLLRNFHVTAVPVVSEDGRPLGVVSLSDPLELGGPVEKHMTTPAGCISVSTTVDDAGRQLASGDRHHLVVVDGAGKAVGMLSVLDVLRSLFDIPARHPSTFPHWDPTTGVSWSDDWPLEPENVLRSPSSPGVLVVTRGARGGPDLMLWAESCVDLRTRVGQLAGRSEREPPALAKVLAEAGLRFRTASVIDDIHRDRITAVLSDRIAHAPPPGAT